MQFSNYMTPMDRDYGRSRVTDVSTNDVGVGIKDIGMSVPLGVAAQNVQGVAAKIRAGAGALEIGFTGAGGGQRGSQTPGMYGKDQRRDLKELAMATEVNLTTHAAYGIMGLAGQDQQGNFSHEYRKLAIDEIKQAIEFASDATKGGSVVVHTGEFQRPIVDQLWAQDKNAPDGFRFKHYGEEEKFGVFRVVDNKTGRLMHQVRKDQEVARPVWLVADKDYEGKDTEDRSTKISKGDYIDYENRKIVDPYDVNKGRVPVFDKESGRFKVLPQKWEHFVEEAKERNIALAKKNNMSYEEFAKKLPDELIRPEEALMQASLETTEAHSRGWALHYAENFGKQQEALKKLRDAAKYYDQLEKTTPESEHWKLMHQVGDMAQRYAPGLVPSEYKKPSQLITEAIKEVTTSMEFAHQGSVSQQQQAQDTLQQRERVISAEKYAIKEAAKAYAEAGFYAMQQTNDKHLEKPLMITMENIFPESYGAHPDEMMNLINKSRQEMVNMLTKRKGMSEEEAKDVAKQHIKSTLDTGHLNMWRKYWNEDPKKSIDENNNEFKKWMLEKVKKLQDEKMIGNVHLVDNYGYNDDHLSPGTGTAPCKEIIEILKKNGYKDAITIEPGADASTDLGDFYGLMKTWKLFGSPIYGAMGPTRTDAPRANWGEVQYSYFGKVHPPYFVFGAYSPSQDWSLWSQVQME